MAGHNRGGIIGGYLYSPRHFGYPAHLNLKTPPKFGGMLFEYSWGRTFSSLISYICSAHAIFGVRGRYVRRLLQPLVNLSCINMPRGDCSADSTHVHKPTV